MSASDNFPYSWDPQSSIGLALKAALIEGGFKAVRDVLVGDRSAVEDNVAKLGTAAGATLGNLPGQVPVVDETGCLPKEVLPSSGSLRPYNTIFIPREIQDIPRLVKYLEHYNPRPLKGDRVIITEGKLTGEWILRTSNLHDTELLVASPYRSDVVSSIVVNGQAFEPVNGIVTLPDYDTKEEIKQLKEEINKLRIIVELQGKILHNFKLIPVDIC